MNNHKNRNIINLERSVILNRNLSSVVGPRQQVEMSFTHIQNVSSHTNLINKWQTSQLHAMGMIRTNDNHYRLLPHQIIEALNILKNGLLTNSNIAHVSEQLANHASVFASKKSAQKSITMPSYTIARGSSYHKNKSIHYSPYSYPVSSNIGTIRSLPPLLSHSNSSNANHSISSFDTQTVSTITTINTDNISRPDMGDINFPDDQSMFMSLPHLPSDDHLSVMNINLE